MVKPVIPLVPVSSDIHRVEFDRSVKQILDTIIGRTSQPIDLLSDSATLADVIAKVNEIIKVLQ